MKFNNQFSSTNLERTYVPHSHETSSYIACILNVLWHFIPNKVVYHQIISSTASPVQDLYLRLRSSPFLSCSSSWRAGSMSISSIPLNNRRADRSWIWELAIGATDRSLLEIKGTHSFVDACAFRPWNLSHLVSGKWSNILTCRTIYNTGTTVALVWLVLDMLKAKKLST